MLHDMRFVGQRKKGGVWWLATVPTQLIHQLSQRVLVGPQSRRPPAISSTSNVDDFVVDEKDGLWREVDGGFHGSIKGPVWFGITQRSGVMQTIELAAEVQPVPKISCPLMFLNRREVDLDAFVPQCLQFSKQAVIDVRVVAKPVINEGVARNRRRYFGERWSKTVSQRGASMHHVIPMLFKKNLLQGWGWYTEVALQISAPPSLIGVLDENAIHIDHDCFALHAR